MTDEPGGRWDVMQLRAWLRGIAPRLDALRPFELLELSPIDDAGAVQRAYHRIATTRHPDLFRGELTPDEAEALTRAFARIAGAYALLRSSAERQKHGARPATPPKGMRKLAPRALSHVRRADAMIATGDLASAILHLRMAIAADPTSAELRQLLAETEAKLRR